MESNGFTLIEVLVALLLLAVGAAGFMSAQIRATDIVAGQIARGQAEFVARDLATRMQINYRQDYTGLPFQAVPPLDCSLSACNDNELALYDVAFSRATIQALLTDGALEIEQCPYPGLTCIKVFWSGKASFESCTDSGLCQMTMWLAR